MRIVLLVAMLAMPLSLRAETAVTVGEGLQLSLEEGAVVLRASGKSVWRESLVSPSAQKGEAEASLTLTALQDDYKAVHARVAEAGAGVTEALILLRKGRSDIRVIWKERTDLRGDPGERVAQAIRLEDLTGDGVPEIVSGTVSEAHRLCGMTSLPLLFRKVYDFKKRSFRPVLAKRVGAAPGADVTGEVYAQPQPEPLIRQISAASASRSAGDNGDVLFLAKPNAAVDRRAETVWTPGVGNGAGEFITFHLSSNVYGMTRLGIRPLPSGKGSAKYDRPKTLLLLTEDGTYRLVFPTDPALSPDATVGFTLPRPTRSHCFSIAVESTFEAGKKRPFGLAELRVWTEVDGPDGMVRLAKDLNDSKARRQAAMLLTQVGPLSEKPIRAQWSKLTVSGRRLAAEVLSSVAPEAAVDLLVEGALAEDKLTREAAVRGLKAAPEKAAATLKPRLFDKDDTVFERAAETAAVLKTPEALSILAAPLGKTNRQRRLRLTGLITQAVSGIPEQIAALLQLVDAAAATGDIERLAALLSTATAFDSLNSRIYQTAASMYDVAAAFKDRYLLLEVLGSVACPREPDRLLAAASDGDLQIRAVALRGLGRCAPSQPIVDALVRGIGDAETAVRLASLDAMYQMRAAGPAVSTALLSEVAARDPWPVVRARTVRLSSLFPRDQVMGMLSSAAGDTSSIVRESALRATFNYFGSDADALIEARLAASNETVSIKSAAAAAAGRRCQASALPLLFSLLREGAEPMAETSAIELARVAARAMGEIGTPVAVSMLKKAAERSNPSTDRAIEAALRNPGGACRAAEQRAPSIEKDLPTPKESPPTQGASEGKQP